MTDKLAQKMARHARDAETYLDLALSPMWKPSDFIAFERAAVAQQLMAGEIARNENRVAALARVVSGEAFQ